MTYRSTVTHHFPCLITLKLFTLLTASYKSGFVIWNKKSISWWQRSSRACRNSFHLKFDVIDSSTEQAWISEHEKNYVSHFCLTLFRQDCQKSGEKTFWDYSGNLVLVLRRALILIKWKGGICYEIIAIRLRVSWSMFWKFSIINIINFAACLSFTICDNCCIPCVWWIFENHKAGCNYYYYCHFSLSTVAQWPTRWIWIRASRHTSYRIWSRTQSTAHVCKPSTEKATPVGRSLWHRKLRKEVSILFL